MPETSPAQPSWPSGLGARVLSDSPCSCDRVGRGRRRHHRRAAVFNSMTIVGLTCIFAFHEPQATDLRAQAIANEPLPTSCMCQVCCEEALSL